VGMSEPEILDGLAEILNEDVGLDAKAVQLDKNFVTDLGIDPASMHRIISSIETRFGVVIAGGQTFNSVGDAVAYIQAEIG
jgi:acyl carrier protein